jgi:hypothetical protein
MGNLVSKIKAANPCLGDDAKRKRNEAKIREREFNKQSKENKAKTLKHRLKKKKEFSSRKNKQSMVDK